MPGYGQGGIVSTTSSRRRTRRSTSPSQPASPDVIAWRWARATSGSGSSPDARHRRVLEEHRDHDAIELEGGRELEPDEVTRVLEPALPLASVTVEPVVADERQHDVDRLIVASMTSLNGSPGSERVHVHEDELGAERGVEVRLETRRIGSACRSAGS